MRDRRFIGGLAVVLAAAALAGHAAEPFGESVPMQQRASGNYYVAGTLAGVVEADFLVDTGSGYVSLAPGVFERLRAAPGTVFLRDIVGSMANGRMLKVPVYRVATLELSPHCVLRDVEVTVMPGSTRNILGLSALRRVAPFALDLDPARLLLSGCDRGVVATAAVGVGGAGQVAMGPRSVTASIATQASPAVASP